MWDMLKNKTFDYPTFQEHELLRKVAAIEKKGGSKASIERKGGGINNTLFKVEG